MTADVPILDGDQLNEQERAILGGFIEESGYVDDSVEFIQCEVPIGLQRLSKAISRVEGEETNIKTDRTFAEVTAERPHSEIPQGLTSRRDLAPQEGGSGNADAVVVKQNEVAVLELKNEMSGLNDTHQGYGQLLLYKELFEEDYPSLMEDMTLSSFVVAGDWNVAPELLNPSYQMHGIGVFEVSQSRWILEPNKMDIPQTTVQTVNPETLKNYDVPLAIAVSGTVRDLARARKVMDNIDPMKDLDPSDFEKFDDISL